MIKRFSFLLTTALLIVSCGPTKQADNPITTVAIDLVNVIDDKVAVIISPATITTDEVVFYIPEIVPGTYSDDDYGLYIENFKAYNSKGVELVATKLDENSWKISDAKSLSSITYLVNDTFDIESEHEIFSPSGTNFKVGEEFLLNLHTMIGYVEGQKDKGYRIEINRPENLGVSTTLPFAAQGTAVSTFANTAVVDRFFADRYFKVIDNPIMYDAGNKEVFTVGDIEIVLNVYSPNNIVKASDLRPNVERMIEAQKAYLGDVDATKKYAILLYLSSGEPDDAQGFGALEHHTSTVVVLPEGMPQQAMDGAMVDVVAHEFFHIVTPLSVHSKEIHNFKFNGPEMSKHLWMYEGVTEYFAQHFQVKEGLINKGEFYDIITGKIQTASAFTDDMSFTEMSKNVLDKPYADEYVNVYAKGALIGMCIDILMRQNSDGSRGILDLMKDLSATYGVDKPFEDDTIISEITAMTYPAVGDFLQKHVVGDTPIKYGNFLASVGLRLGTQKVATGYFLNGNQPYISGDAQKNEIFIIPGTDTTFFSSLGIQGGDVIKSINDKAYNLENVYDLISDSNSWKTGDDITMEVTRDGEILSLSGKVVQPKVDSQTITEIQYLTPSKQQKLREAWLMGS